MNTVLVIDNDPKFLKMLRRTLAYDNLQVFTASNSIDALPILNFQKPDLLIVDWMTTGMDGLTLMHAMPADKHKTLVLMLTAQDMQESRVSGLKAGADDYLDKPFAPAELAVHVHALLQRIEANMENA